MNDDRSPTGQPEPSDDDQAARAAWDRVGRYMEGLGAVGERLVQRNFTFWKDVASSLQSGPMDADKFAATAARAMVATQETVEDVWTSLVEPPQSEVYVQVLPTAFLFFDQIGGNRHTLQDPVHIPVSPQRKGDLPDTAEIALNGSPADGSVDAADAVRVLTDRLRTSLIPGARSYLLETVEQGPVTPLVPGTYDGLIYLIKPSLPLANLRIIVDGPPPEV
jgi:hypothetical protein